MIEAFIKSPPVCMRWRGMNWPATPRRIVTLAFFVLMNWLFLAPASTFQDVHVFLSHQDKLVHFGIFNMLAGLVWWSVPAPCGRGTPGTVLVLALLAYGAGIECLQPLMPGAGRTFEWIDLLLDAAGVVLGIWTCEALSRKECPELVPEI
jgi:VanZ family protein